MCSRPAQSFGLCHRERAAGWPVDGRSDTKKVYVTQPDGKIIDATTGATVASIPDSAAAVRLNNKLRRHVEAALGALTLQSPDPAKRVQAAQSCSRLMTRPCCR